MMLVLNNTGNNKTTLILTVYLNFTKSSTHDSCAETMIIRTVVKDVGMLTFGLSCYVFRNSENN